MVGNWKSRVNPGNLDDGGSGTMAHGYACSARKKSGGSLTEVPNSNSGKTALEEGSLEGEYQGVKVFTTGLTGDTANVGFSMKRLKRGTGLRERRCPIR